MASPPPLPGMLMFVLLSFLLSPLALAGEPQCERPWLSGPTTSAATQGCVSHWLGLVYGSDWSEESIEFDPELSLRGPESLSVRQLQEARARFRELNHAEPHFRLTRILEGIDHMLAMRIGFRDVIDGVMPASYRGTLMAVLSGQSLGEGDLVPHPGMLFSAGTYRVLRNAAYARHGRAFKSADLQDFFYGPEASLRFGDLKLSVSAAYADSLLTATDRDNVALIQRFEKKAKEQEARLE